MHFPVFSLILGLLVVVHASPLKSANQPVSSIKDAPKLVPRSSPESAGNTTPAEVAYMQCIALWVRWIRTTASKGAERAAFGDHGEHC